MVMGRFMYGPLDMVTLTGEKVTPTTQKEATVFWRRDAIKTAAVCNFPVDRHPHHDAASLRGVGPLPDRAHQRQRPRLLRRPREQAARHRGLSCQDGGQVRQTLCGRLDLLFLFIVGELQRLEVCLFLLRFYRGDHTFADSYLTVVPRGTEFVVFSIDGSFAASVSIMGSDPKVRAGAVDVVR